MYIMYIISLFELTKKIKLILVIPGLQSSMEGGM
jgi:hypothetical protein